MAHYIVSFIVYTCAMSGLIALALFVYKKVTNISSTGRKTKMLSVEEVLNINPRKALMIVRAGDERFLLASDVDKTTLISKLGENSNIHDAIVKNKSENTVKSSVVDLEKINTSIEKENVDVLFPPKNSTNNKTKNIVPQKTDNKLKKSKKTNEIHLEVISNKNPNAPERNRNFTTTNRRKNVTIEVGEIKNHGLSTIKELVHKVNEL